MHRLRTLLAVAAFLALLSACDRQAGTGAPAATDSKPAAETATVPKTVDGVELRQLKKPLAPKVAIGFPYQLRMDKTDEDKEAGVRRRRVSLEYLNTDAASVDRSLSDALTGAGFRKANAKETDGTIRTLYKRKDGSTVVTSVRPPQPDIKMTAPGAKGTVGIVWQQRL